MEKPYVTVSRLDQDQQFLVQQDNWWGIASQNEHWYPITSLGAQRDYVTKNIEQCSVMFIHQWGNFPKVPIPTRENMDQESVLILSLDHICTDS